MTGCLDRRLARLAVLGVLAALVLAGCGRKSALELPPSASIAQPGPAPAPPPSLGEADPGTAFLPRMGAQTAAPPPPAPPANSAQRTFLLDPLLN